MSTQIVDIITNLDRRNRTLWQRFWLRIAAWERKHAGIGEWLEWFTFGNTDRASRLFLAIVLCLLTVIMIANRVWSAAVLFGALAAISWRSGR